MDETNTTPETGTDALMTSVATIVAAALGGGLSIDAVPEFIGTVKSKLLEDSSTTTVETKEELVPAVSIRTSVKPDFIVCLEDGKKLKMLRRHLMTHYGMTPEDYRAKWSLPTDYPMVAPNYSERRRELAKNIGLGTKTANGRRGGRKPKAKATEAA